VNRLLAMVRAAHIYHPLFFVTVVVLFIAGIAFYMMKFVVNFNNRELLNED